MAAICAAAGACAVAAAALAGDPVAAPPQPAASVVLAPVFSCDTPGYAQPFAGHNGKHVLYANGVKVDGIDTQTSLVRWQGGELESVRRIKDLDDRILMIGEHVQVIDKERGQRVWDFPLNCFPGGQCNADVLALTEDRMLVAGFGVLYNMVQLVGLDDGKEQWPSWVSTCGIRLAGVAADSVLLVCATDNPFLQRIGMANRMTMYTTPTPAAGFKPSEAWFSADFVYVVGMLEGQKKLYVFATADGKLTGKFNIKPSAPGQEMGFVISPDAARFVPWQSSQGELTLWGIDVSTGKAAWQSQWPEGHIAGQHRAVLALLSRTRDGHAAAGLDLSTGKEKFSYPLPFSDPVGLVQDGTFLVVEKLPKDARFVAIDTETGQVTRIGTLPGASGAAVDRMFFSSGNNGFVAVVGKQVTLFAATSIPDQVNKLTTLLDQGDDAAAGELFAGLAPFRKTLPEAGAAFQAVARHRWLQTRLKLRHHDSAGAARIFAAVLVDAGEWSRTEFAELFNPLAGAGLELALSAGASATRDDALLDVLRLLAAHAPDADPAHAHVLADTAVALALALDSGAHKVKAAQCVDALLEIPALAAFFDGHPYSLAREIADVETALELADGSYREGDMQMAADLLRDLSGKPIAARIFGPASDPWLDAAGLYLLPPGDQALKLPDILKGLSSQLARGRRQIERQARDELCLLACDAAGQVCPGTCINERSCTAAVARCRGECARGKLSWSPPEFTVSPTSTRFYQCR